MTDRPYLDDGDVAVYLADCVEQMRAMPAGSVDAIVTDPPYGLGFMGKEWDDPLMLGQASGLLNGQKGTKTRGYADNDPAAFQAWCEEWAREALRVAKPGAHLCAFGGTRTFHRLACAIEDAGWEVRDCAAWIYGSGFPKSLDVSKAIDKAAGAERAIVGERRGGAAMNVNGDNPRPWHARQAERGGAYDVTAPATPDAEAWAGWGTALKPAWEPIIVARKPLVGTVAANVLRHGTGALNIDACRIGFASDADEAESKGKNRHADYGSTQGSKHTYGDYSMVEPKNYDPPGRWPANVVLDEDAAAILDEQSGDSRSPSGPVRQGGRQGFGHGAQNGQERSGYGIGYGDSGGASRFFYTAKADREERQAPDGTRNTHPTVKPTDLMRWLVKLVTPPGGVVLDPFAGSGSTGVAARAEGFRAILVEREAEYAAIIASRLSQQTLL